MTEAVIQYVFQVALPWGEDSQSVLFPLCCSDAVFVWICRTGLLGRGRGGEMKIQRGRSDEGRVSGLNSCQNMDQTCFFPSRASLSCCNCS